MALTSRKAGGGSEQVDIKISATDEASGQINLIDNSLANLQVKIKTLSATVSELAANVSSSTSSALRQVTATGAAITAATAGVAGNGGLRQALEGIGTALDQGLFSRRGTLSDILGYAGTGAKPLVDGILFGNSEQNTRNIVRDKGRRLAQELIANLDLSKNLGKTLGAINPLLEGVGSDIGKGLTAGLKKTFVDQTGETFVKSFDNIVKATERLAPKLKGASQTIGGFFGQNLEIRRQNLEFEIADTAFQAKVAEQGGEESRKKDAEARVAVLKNELALLNSVSKFDRLTASFRTGEGVGKATASAKKAAADRVSAVQKGFDDELRILEERKARGEQIDKEMEDLRKRRAAVDVRERVSGFRRGIDQEISALKDRRAAIEREREGGEGGEAVPRDRDLIDAEARALDKKLREADQRKRVVDAAERFSGSFIGPVIDSIQESIERDLQSLEQQKQGLVDAGLPEDAAKIDKEIASATQRKAAADAISKISGNFIGPVVDSLYRGTFRRLGAAFDSGDLKRFAVDAAQRLSGFLGEGGGGEPIGAGLKKSLESFKLDPKAEEALSRIKDGFKAIDLSQVKQTAKAVSSVFAGFGDVGRNIAGSIYSGIVSNLRVSDAVRAQLKTIPDRVGAGEVGRFVGFRLATAISDGLSAGIRTKVANSINFLDKQLNAVVSNTSQATDRIARGLQQAGAGVGVVSGLKEPGQLFGLIKQQVGQATGAIARISEEISYFSYALSSLKQFVIGGPYELLINQNVKLQEQLLATKASIVANNKVLSEGLKVEDPAQAIKDLGAPIEAAISYIRKGSLELVGVTSKDLIEVFNIITQQISNVNLDLDEAADLTLSFAAGLGTIGLPLNQARQEIQSILTGTVDMNSVLAKSLGITNAQLKTWIAQDVVYQRLNSRLEAFVQGNSLAAKTIGGVTSNIQEIVDEMGRVAGAQFLGPIVEQLTRAYSFLDQNQVTLISTAEERLGELGGALKQVGIAAAAVGEDFVPILGNIGKLLWETLINVIEATGVALEQFKVVLAPFVPILTAITELIKAAGGPVLQLAVSFSVLGTGIGLVRTMMGTLIGAIPILGEALFLLELRNGQLVNTFVSLANPKTGIGASAATILLLGRNMNTIPGVAGIVGARLQNAFGPLAGLVSAAIPPLSTFGLRLFALGQQIEPVGRILKGLSAQMPAAILGFTTFAGRIKVGGVALSELMGPLRTLAQEMDVLTSAGGDLGDLLNRKMEGLLQEQGRLARNTAIRYGIWGAAIVGIAGSISLLLIKNDALRVVLEGLFNIIKKIAVAIVNLLMEPLTQVLILVTSLTAAIATGLATQVARMTIEFARFAATQAPITLKLMVDQLRAMITLLRTTEISSIGSLFAGIGGRGAATAAAGTAAATGGAAVATAGEQLSLFDLQPIPEKRKKRKPQTQQLDLFETLPDQQEIAAKRNKELSESLIGARVEMSATSKTAGAAAKSTAAAAAGTTALGNAQVFVAKTTAALGATMKALVVTLGPIVGIVALFSAWGYAIDQVTKASQIQKEMQEELLKVLKEQEVTIAKIQSLQGKQIENPLLEQITEADLKTGEERRAFKEGGAEQVLALRKARDFNDDGVRKSGIRRLGEQALDVTGQVVTAAVLGVPGKLAEAAPNDPAASRWASAIEGRIASTGTTRKLQAKEEAGIRVLQDAAGFLKQTTAGQVDENSQIVAGTSTKAQIQSLMKQAQETEKLLTEARAKGLESRARELEQKLEEETEVYKKAQDEILQYASSLENADWANSAQRSNALNTARLLRAAVADLEEEITVTGVDFARLGTSFEQLRVESENALAFFRKGEGNPEQVKQRAGQLLSSTQQLFEDSLISSEQALANYAVLFQRNSALELDDQKKLQEAILAARQKQVEGAVKLEEAKVARLKQLAAEGEVGQFESELGSLELERQKAEIQLKGLRTSYEEQNRLRVARFQDASGQISADLSRSQRELAIGTNPAIAAKAQADVNRLMAERLDLEDKLAAAKERVTYSTSEGEEAIAAEVERNNAAIVAIEQRRAVVQAGLEAAEKTLAGTNIGGEAADALQTEIAGYQEQLASLGESFRNQQRSANRNFVTEEANLIAQIAESQNQELELRLKELQDRANSALDESMAKRKAQFQELRKAGIIFEEQQNLAVAKLQEERVEQDLALERRRLREYMANPKRFEREIRESNKRIAQLTLERFEAERNSWERQLALFQRYVDDQAEAAKNAIEIENQELIKQSKLYEAISQAISARNELLGKAKDFTQATGSAVADTLERIAKLTGNEVLQADLATSAAIIRRDTLAKQLEIQSKIFEIEQKQAEIALIRREAENAIALAKAKQQILSAQGAVVVAEQQFKRGDITEAELTGKRLELLGAVTDYQGLELERNVIAQERQLQPVLQELLRQQQQQEAQSQIDAADIAVLETLPQGLSLEAQNEMAVRLGDRLGIKASDMKDLAEQIRGVRGELQSGYAQGTYGDPNIFADDIGFREAQMQAGPGYRNIERLKAQGIDLGFYSELEKITASPIASVPVVEDGERFLDRGTSGRASAGAFDEQTGPLLDILSGVETATAGMDESIAGLEESFSSVSLENLQSVLPEIVGRDAIIDATFEGSGKVEAAINEGLALSNETLETITDGLEPLAEVRDFLGEDGPLKMSLDNLNLEPYLGENAELLRTTTSIASGVEAIVAALPGTIAPEAAPAAEAAAEESTQPKQDDPPLRQREINSFIRQFETLISKEALEKARSKESDSGRRVTETELRDLIASSISPFRLEGSKLNLETASTGQILEAFRTAVTDAQTETTGRGGRGGRTRTTYEIKPNLTFNVQGNPDERTIAREAVRQFETILNRAIAQG